jgi:hypothetical protein
MPSRRRSAQRATETWTGAGRRAKETCWRGYGRGGEVGFYGGSLTRSRGPRLAASRALCRPRWTSPIELPTLPNAVTGARRRVPSTGRRDPSEQFARLCGGWECGLLGIHGWPWSVEHGSGATLGSGRREVLMDGRSCDWDRVWCLRLLSSNRILTLSSIFLRHRVASGLLRRTYRLWFGIAPIASVEIRGYD